MHTKKIQAAPRPPHPTTRRLAPKLSPIFCIRFLLSGIGLSVCLFSVSAQTTLSSDSLRFRKKSLGVVPLLFYTPETSLGFGAAGVASFGWKPATERDRASQVQLVASYTLRDQILFYLPFTLFGPQDSWRLNGELGAYRYVYPYYGIGNETNAADEEFYQATYPRVRLQGLLPLTPSWFAGLSWAYDNYRITDLEEEGLIASRRPVGSEGGVMTGAGLITQIDTRDDNFYPTEGYFGTLEYLINDPALGSAYAYQHLMLNLSYYLPLGQGSILVLNTTQEYLSGAPPLQELALLGGSRRLRGHIDGRYRDKALWILQAEYRFPIAGRFSGVGFAGSGQVAPTLSAFQLDAIHWNYGAGLRFQLSKEESLNVRLDVGIDDRFTWQPYLTIGEAF